MQLKHQYPEYHFWLQKMNSVERKQSNFSETIAPNQCRSSVDVRLGERTWRRSWSIPLGCKKEVRKWKKDTQILTTQIKRKNDGIVGLVAALMVLLFTLRSDKSVDQMMTTKSKQKEKMGTKKNAHYSIAPEDCPDWTGHPRGAIGKVAGNQTTNSIDGGQLTLLTPAAFFDIALQDSRLKKNRVLWKYLCCRDFIPPLLHVVTSSNSRREHSAVSSVRANCQLSRAVVRCVNRL